MTSTDEFLSFIQDTERRRTKARQILESSMNVLSVVAYQELKLKFKYTDINLSQTEASMRSVFKGTNFEGLKCERELDVRKKFLGIF